MENTKCFCCCWSSRRFMLALFGITVVTILYTITLLIDQKTEQKHQRLPSPKSAHLKIGKTPPCGNIKDMSPASKGEADVAKFRKEILLQLQCLHSELSKTNSKKLSIDAPLQKLQYMVQALDSQSKPTRNPSTSQDVKKVQEPQILDVCPESFPPKYGKDSGYPFFETGWKMVKCTNVKQFQDVITILLNMKDIPERDEKHAPAVLRGINITYPKLQVFLAVKKSSKIVDIAKSYRKVTIVEMDEKSTTGNVWNLLVTKVNTPYVLIGRDVSHFSWLSRLERQVRVVSSVPNVKVAGGSFRNTTGHWKVGCYQKKLLNYVLEYQEGYFHSKNECMYCDHLVGPFVTKTDLLKSVKFDESLSKELFMEDWFLRVRENNHDVMKCPDAMYFTAEDYDYGLHAKVFIKDTWLPLAKKWTLNRIVLPGNVIHKFSCRDIGYKCKTGITSSMALPICCSEQQASALKFFHDFCDSNKLSYELDSGTVLNAAKFGTMLPWEMDGDLIVYAANVSVFAKSETQAAFKKAGFPISGFKAAVKDAKGGWSSSGFFYLTTPDMYFEVWGFPRISNHEFLPPDIGHIRTQVLYGGRWVIGPYNPGLYARNRYGHEVYKHAQHWIVTGGHSGWDYYHPGSFKKCKNPKFHGCLDKLPADGNIPWFVH